MGQPAKSDGVALLAIAMLHLAAQVAHGYSHVAGGVPLTAFQQLFIVAVVTVAPFGAVYVHWELDRQRGAGLFAVSMGAAFLFGYLLHFVIDSPDLHANVTGEHSALFFHSALGLALTEFVGCFFGAYFAARGTRRAAPATD